MTGEGESLDSATANIDEILLKGLIAQRVCNRKCLRLALLVLCGQTERISGFEKTGGSSEITKLGIVEIAEHGFSAWSLHGVPVV